MIIVDEVFDKMLESIKKALPSFHSHRRIARKYARRFQYGFSDSDREFVIKEILHQQNRSIIKAISEKKNIAIPFLGTFQYRESLELSREIKNEVKAEYGLQPNFRLSDLSEEDYMKITEEIRERKKQVLVPLYFKQINIKGSTVNYNFLKK